MGKVLRQNCLINIREESVEAAYQQYVELRKLILNGAEEKKFDDGVEENTIEKSPDAMMCDECGQEMTLREGRSGFFWGCSGYPQCRNTKSAFESASGATSNKMETSKQSRQEDNSPVPVCPRHKVKMLIRTRKSDGELFFGCAMFNQKGCLEILPYPAQKKANVKVPAVTY
ncbi:topoisomerase DNA-binding C4 zinc finger domain-containing protein [Patescibacteria group bacterium]|nr:topoisomerase DNA-binding C4 zinc finger domain-containing protein [Patescibacteria group bacterium]